MNAMSTSPADLVEESNNGGSGGSDSDTNHDDVPEYYQPISAVDDDDDDDDDREGSGDQVNSDEEHRHYENLSNGYVSRVENEISSLQVAAAEEEEEEEERMREASDTAIRRAFREDESRRNAPLTAENAMRVREAMRGVSFGGLAPDWTNQFPEDSWIDQLRRSRQPQRRPSNIVQNS